MNELEKQDIDNDKTDDAVTIFSASIESDLNNGRNRRSNYRPMIADNHNAEVAERYAEEKAKEVLMAIFKGADAMFEHMNIEH